LATYIKRWPIYECIYVKDSKLMKYKNKKISKIKYIQSDAFKVLQVLSLKVCIELKIKNVQTKIE